MKRKVFTLIELLVVVAIIAVLVAILLPALSRARESARTAICKTHLKDIGLALNAYEEEYHKYPIADPGSWGWGDTWNKVLIAERYFDIQEDVFDCPTIEGKGLYNDYLLNNLNWGDDYPNRREVGPSGHRLSEVEYPARTVLVMDGRSFELTTLPGAFDVVDLGPDRAIGTNIGGTGVVHYFHSKAANFLFCDYHVETYPAPKEINPSSGLVWRMFVIGDVKTIHYPYP